MAITLGPFTFAAELLATFLALLLGMAAGTHVAARRGVSVERFQWIVVVATIVAARAAFVLAYWPHYRAAPWSVLDLRDGGLTAWAGMAAALLAGAALAWRDRLRRGALAAGVGTGLVVWCLAAGLTALLAPVPQSLPSMTLTGVDGQPVALASLAGKPVVVNLWASWCPPCRREMPALVLAQQQHPDVTFVFANQGESAAVVRQYLQRHRLVLRNVVLDPGGELARTVGSTGLPTTLFFDARGVMVDHRMGELSAATLAQRVASVRAAPAPAR